MTVHSLPEFKLSPVDAGLGLSCSAKGAFIDAIPLLNKVQESGREVWQPRRCAEISEELSERYGLPFDMSSRASGLRAIAKALNEGQIAHAQLAALHLRFPEPPTLEKNESWREETIWFIRNLHAGGLIKADWDPDKHPRWPAGAPDSRGGQFAQLGEIVAASGTTSSDVGSHVNLQDVAYRRFAVSLVEHEGAGGHTIAEHVGKSFQYLKGRLQANLMLDAASSFTTLAAAQNLVNATLSAGASDLFEEDRPSHRLVWGDAMATFTKPTGYILDRGSNALVPTYSVAVFFIRPAPTRDGFLVVSAYPF